MIASSDVALTSSEVWRPPVPGVPNDAWTWTQLPAMSAGRFDLCGCVMSNGRSAVVSGKNESGDILSCDAFIVGENEHWHPLLSMHHARSGFACAAVARCIIVAGGRGTTSAEVYDEVLDRWILLPCELLGDCQEWTFFGSALL